MERPLLEGNRVALVVGNTAYRYGPLLSNPRSDSSAIAAVFERLGFTHVALHQDVGLIELGRGISDFRVKAEAADMAVVYFAGHGLELEGQNFLVPVDAELEHVGRIPFETILLDNILSVVSASKLLRLIILDACRDNPFSGRTRGLQGTRSFGSGLSNIEPGGNTLVAYAAKHGTKARDGPIGGNSPYAEALLQYLETPDLEIRLLFGRVRDAVLKRTGNVQEPHLYGSLGGEEIYLKQTRQKDIIQNSEAGQKEAEARWQEFRLDGTENVQLLEAWLAQYGTRAPMLGLVARKRVDEINKSRQQRRAADWSATKAENTIAAYDTYLARWPGGSYATEAIERRTVLREGQPSAHPAGGATRKGCKGRAKTGALAFHAAGKPAALLFTAKPKNRADPRDASSAALAMRSRLGQLGTKRLPVVTLGMVTVALALGLGYVVIGSKGPPQHAPQPSPPVVAKSAEERSHSTPLFFPPSGPQPNNRMFFKWP
jgi:Caspase domain